MTRRVAALVCALGLVACATGPQGASRGAPPGPGPAAAAPMPLTGSRWVGSHYCEEFAEAHAKAMVQAAERHLRRAQETERLKA